MRAPLKQRIKEWFCKHLGHRNGEVNQGPRGEWTVCRRCNWVITLNPKSDIKRGEKMK